ncbi:hypothetical protein O7627_16920 [Solwaraspora sp. WMMD1047]|uniref:hypothetical protein n=1 Tax=Solwaraspora sp. WMMD1047 TaxID=3016102 RepID=UPI002417738D|nr:hypothetical protein [Solwaraspora sp. WMMD1047]MDG4830976.1 hypothetical protein [Solwaraspora sp. WMMD1047]
MKTTLFSRWLPAIAKDTGRTTAAVVLLGLVIGAPAAVDAAQESAQPGAGPTATAPADPAEKRTAEQSASRSAADRTDPDTERPEAEQPRAAEKPSMEALIPHGTQGPQQVVDWNDQQVANAEAIVDTTKKLGFDERAAVVAVATAMQESTLNNFGHLGARNDHDSQGLFQQRPSSGWGSPAQITDPEYATTAFLRALERVDGWRQMPLTGAAQTVQVSAYPYHYAKWEQEAAELVQELWTR